jgi:adenine-specific DNA methylase
MLVKSINQRYLWYLRFTVVTMVTYNSSLCLWESTILTVKWIITSNHHTDTAVRCDLQYIQYHQESSVNYMCNIRNIQGLVSTLQVAESNKTDWKENKIIHHYQNMHFFFKITIYFPFKTDFITGLRSNYFFFLHGLPNKYLFIFIA